MRFIIARWHYFWAYCIIILSAVLATWLYDKAYDFWSWTATILAVVLLIIFELLIRSEQIIVGSKSVFYSKGFSEKKSFRISSKISIRQNWLQELLRYGTVEFYLEDKKVIVKGIGLVKKLKELSEKASKNSNF